MKPLFHQPRRARHPLGAVHGQLREDVQRKGLCCGVVYTVILHTIREVLDVAAASTHDQVAVLGVL